MSKLIPEGPPKTFEQEFKEAENQIMWARYRLSQLLKRLVPAATPKVKVADLITQIEAALAIIHPTGEE